MVCWRLRKLTQHMILPQWSCLRHDFSKICNRNQLPKNQEHNKQVRSVIVAYTN